MRKLIEAVEEGMFDRAPKAQGTFARDPRNKSSNYSELAQNMKIEITIPSPGYFGVSWVDANGNARYEEAEQDAIVSLDQLVDFAISEGDK